MIIEKWKDDQYPDWVNRGQLSQKDIGLTKDKAHKKALAMWGK